MRLACTGLVMLSLLGLAGCASLGQDIYDMFAEASCSPANSSSEERACLDSVEENSRERRRGD